MKPYLFAIVFLASILSVSAQEDKNFPALISQDLPGGEITRTSYYGGDALWGLINGGADIYLEYGFDKLLLQEIEWKGVKFRVEFYRMMDAKAAFGIFSVSRYKCALSDTLTKYICITSYQVQAAIGQFYISIANDKGNKEAQILTTELFKNVLVKINETEFELPVVFNQNAFNSYKSQMKLMKGRLGLQNGFPMWSEMFDKYFNYEIYLLPIESEKGYVYISQIKFESEKEMQKFVDENKSGNQNNISKKIKQLSVNEILFIEKNFDSIDLEKLLNSI